jgi:hypothetical protein
MRVSPTVAILLGIALLLLVIFGLRALDSDGYSPPAKYCGMAVPPVTDAASAANGPASAADGRCDPSDGRTRLVGGAPVPNAGVARAPIGMIATT